MRNNFLNRRSFRLWQESRAKLLRTIYVHSFILILSTYVRWRLEKEKINADGR